MNTFTNDAPGVYGDSRPYSENLYEASPANRVLGQYGPGISWYSNDKKTEIEHQTNGTSEVIKFDYASSYFKRNGYYAANTLYKTVTKDEDGKTFTEYKDKLGQVILQRKGTNVDTYFIYDDFGRVIYVLPPNVVDQTPEAYICYDNYTLMKKYAYVYKYDYKNNLIIKQLPGCDQVYMVYDKTNRLVMSQDGNQRAQTPDRWTVYKYDMLGRLLYSSEIKDGNSHTYYMNLFKDFLTVETFSTGSLTNPMEETGYSRNFFIAQPTRLLTVNYYDNYNFLVKLPTNKKDTLSYDSSKESMNFGIAKKDSVKGLLTGTRTYLLDGSGTYIATAIYYDERGRVVQTRSTNHLNGYDLSYNQYDFAGKVMKTQTDHKIAGKAFIPEVYTYTYDHAGRLKNTTYQLNNLASVVLSSKSYNDLGQLTGNLRSNLIETGSYTYNIRNWVTKIKSGSFEENIYYNPSSTTAYYNGNIASVTWTYGSVIKDYTYSYDELNRLKDATTSTNTNAEHFTYDKQGNIATLTRQKGSTSIDNLVMTYNGNQVTSITDASGSQNLYNTKEYYNKKDSLNEMSYDNNGNMIKDLDREIVTIRYNILNLPDTVQFKNGNQIINRYSADGSKLSTIYFTRVTAITSPIIPGKVCNWTHTPGTVIKSGMDIVANLEYTLSGNTRYLTKVLNSEGYSDNVTSNSYFYIYHKDHLGSNHELIRANYAFNTTQYYPSGLTWAEGNSYYAMPNKFNGKEFVEMHGFDTYDYGARGYYSTIGRFTTIDPCAESDYSISPYAYCGNNPVNRIDPDGRQTRNYLLNEVVIKSAKQLGDEAWNYLLHGHGKDEEGDGYNVNASYGITKKTIVKGNDTGGTAGVRAPDFYSLNVTVAIPNPITATIVGWSGSISIDRHGQIFISHYGVGVGKSALSASASLTANWMLQSNKPKANETYNFLSGHGISIGGGYYGGVNWAISPTNSGTKDAIGIGLYTPQVGASYNYTPKYLIINKQ